MLPKMYPNPFFCQNKYLTDMMEKIVHICMYSTSVILKKLPEVNNRPMDENSPNPVTVLPDNFSRERA
jgi:hypothetical protein